MSKDSKELFLEDNILITSKTDLRGNITYCNKAFIDISEYRESELIDKAHNILRHEDMPKSVFKILWMHLKRKEEIFAFVKNKTKNNNFYWVFANVTPSFNINLEVIGYYSVRRKVNRNTLNFTQDIYSDLIKIEKKEGMESGYLKILDLMQKQNLSYNNLILKIQLGEI